MNTVPPNDRLPRNETEYRALLAAREADPVAAAQDRALLEYALAMPCPRSKPKRKGGLPDDVLTALSRNGRGSGWNNRRPDVQRFELANVYGHAPCTLLVVPAVAFTRSAERARDERMHGRCLWWNQWARDVGWAIGKPTPQQVQEPPAWGACGMTRKTETEPMLRGPQP